MENKNKNPFLFTREFKNGVYITEVECLINSIPIGRKSLSDSLFIRIKISFISENTRNDITEHECIRLFTRLNKVAGIYGTPCTIGISYEAFKKSYFFLAFDLSVDKKAYIAEFSPIVRTGSLIVRIRFNKALAEQLQMLCLAEYSSCAIINATRTVSVGFSA